ncbi:GIY-YIG nuclease family protein [Massilia sp. LjRoot122]|uniref:GIY-YIG nuclease family protein n=1 Tax=Massilia sp. LjRoot122 TaxID=3342257 RepID=UPI003ECFD5A5
MSAGYLYILSNPALSSDVFKIGLTEALPEERAAELSRQSAIPLQFTLEWHIPVENVVVAERRVHLLLDERRVNPAKEFFRLPLAEAKAMCVAIAEYEQEDGSISSEIGLSDRLLGAHYSPGRSVKRQLLIYLMMGGTTNNTALDRLMRERRGVADGFLTAPQVCDYFRVGNRAASRTMRSLAQQGTATSCRRFDDPTGIVVFDFVRYHKGHLAWRFTDDFRQHFRNPKF